MSRAYAYEFAAAMFPRQSTASAFAMHIEWLVVAEPALPESKNNNGL
jgi:hypothetical protein